MLGRIVGFASGAAMATTGYGMLRPAMFARYVDFTRLSLGPFAEYKAIVCWMIVAFGAVVALAALQRPAAGGRRRRSAPAVFEPGDTDRAPARGHGPLNLGPEPDDEPTPHPLDRHEIHASEPAH